MKKATLTLIAAGVYCIGSVAVTAQSTPQPRKGSAETGLIGIALYDTGTKVVSRFGSPNDIQALTIGTAAGGGGGGLGASGGSGAGGGGGGGATSANVDWNDDMIGDPFGLGNTDWQRVAPQDAPQAAGANSAGGRSGPPSVGGDAGGTNTGTSNRVVFTRWVYERSNSKYSFVLDKFNRVIQIEAIGIKNSSVKTKRGITFGSSFSTIIKAYNAPDGYEVAGDNIVVRYLVRDNVAFRLSKLDADKPHVVTGVVVAAGKT